MKDAIDTAEFRQWISTSLERRENILAVSNQGTLLHFRGDGRDLVVKAAMGGAALRAVRERTLRREYEAYLRMDGLNGIPRCHGMVAGHYLVLDFVRGKPYREAEWHDRAGWFDALLAALRAIHQRGVSHGDLKSKSNLMVTEDEQPCIIDFGTAFVHRQGFHPVNNWLFEHARRMDLNAYVKHKYHGRYEDVSGSDLELLDYSGLEFWVRRLSGRPVHQIPRRR